jgi:hypothetical protein
MSLSSRSGQGKFESVTAIRTTDQEDSIESDAEGVRWTPAMVRRLGVLLGALLLATASGGNEPSTRTLILSFPTLHGGSMTPSTTSHGVDDGPFERLRTAALAAMVGGAAGSVAWMVYASARVHAPRLLVAAFILWVLSPFGLMAAGHALSRRWRWSIQARAALDRWIIAIAVASLIVYGVAALGASRPKTPPFVLVPPASWLAFALVVTIAAVRSRTQRAGLMADPRAAGDELPVGKTDWR